jgi:hypothetical protein
MREDDQDVVSSTLMQLSKDFAGDVAVEDALARVTCAAVELIEEIDHADVLLIDRGEFRSVAATSPIAVRLDSAQHELQQGPCLEAAVADAVVRAPDVAQDLRWPRFGPLAAESGIHRMLCYQLYSHQHASAVLNLFGWGAGNLDFEAEAIGAMLATHAAAVLVAADRRHQFESALASRDIIAQAKGIIMERFSLDANQAFQLLRRLSQNQNTAVRVIAAGLVARTCGRQTQREPRVREATAG